MRLANLMARLISGSLALALVFSSCPAMAAPQQGSVSRAGQNESSAGQTPLPTPQPPNQQVDDQQLPDSPGAAQAQVAIPSSQVNAGDTNAGEPAATDSPLPKPDEKSKPVGTAAAETSRTMGFAVAKPAGTAMAPAKPRRVRTIVIAVAAVVGAGIALGTVAALSKATPSKPPGAH